MHILRLPGSAHAHDIVACWLNFMPLSSCHLHLGLEVAENRKDSHTGTVEGAETCMLNLWRELSPLHA